MAVDEIAMDIKHLGIVRKELKAKLREVEGKLKIALRQGAYQAHLSEQVMAAVAGLSQGQVSKWISGKTTSDYYRAGATKCSYPHGQCLKEVRG